MLGFAHQDSSILVRGPWVYPITRPNAHPIYRPQGLALWRRPGTLVDPPPHRTRLPHSAPPFPPKPLRPRRSRGAAERMFGLRRISWDTSATSSRRANKLGVSRSLGFRRRGAGSVESVEAAWFFCLEVGVDSTGIALVFGGVGGWVGRWM